MEQTFASSLESSSPLDAFVELLDFSAHLPAHVSCNRHAERELVLATMKDYLRDDRILRDHGALMHCFRLWSDMEPVVARGIDAEDIFWMLSRMWKLYDTLDSSNHRLQYRLLDILYSLSAHFRRRRAPVWAKRTAASRYTDIEGFGKRLQAVIPWATMFERIVARLRTPFVSDLATSKERNAQHLTYLVQMAHKLRSHWELTPDYAATLMAAVREGFQKDHSTFDMVLWLRLLLLFAGKRSCFQYVKDGSLFELWNHSSGCFLPTWSATFFALLLRALKYAWASGQSLSDDLQPYLPNLFQSVVGEVGLYSATGGLMRISKTKIPSQYGPLLSAFNPKLLDRMAGVFVFLMSPADSEVFEYVRTLFNLCTPFMNPSTSNVVQKQMSVFMDDLVTHYTRRVYRERMSPDIVAVPETSRMPLDSDDWLVELCEAFTFQSVFARDYKVVRRAEMTMKKLVHLRPHTLLLPVVHRCVNVLENKSQSLHLATMYRVLVTLSSLIFQIAPQFVPLLIEAALPGLDPSDPTKTMAAIPFFLGLVGQMQLVDATDLTITIEDCDEFLAKVRSVSGCFVRPSPGVEAVHSSIHDDIFVTPDLSTAEGLLETVHARQAVSCQFPEFGYSLFDRLLTIASHITPVGAGSSRDSRLSESEIQLLSGIRNGIGLVSSQVDEAGFRRMARTVLDWVKGKALPPKVAAMVVLGLSIGDPSATFTTFLQPLVSVLLKDEKFDPKLEVSGLKKYLSVVSAIVRMAAAEVRHHWPTLKMIIQNAFDASDKGVFKLGMKLLRRCIESHLVTYPRSFSAFSKELRYSDGVRKKLLIMTGESWLLEQICIPELRKPIEWRFPTKEDVGFGRELAAWGFQYAVACIRSCCDEPLPESIAQLESFFPGEHSQVQLSADVAGLPRIKLLTRGINTIRATIRGLSCVYVDERPVAPSTLCIALDMPSDNAALTNALGQAILGTATLFLGIQLESDLLATPPTALQTDMGSEEPKLRRKFLRLLGQVLIRPSASFFPRGRAGNQSFRTFVAWFSPLSKVYPHCHWQNLSSYFWIEQLGRFWESRLTSRKNDIPFQGTRRQLIMLVTHFSIQKYATVRAFAQEVLTACCSVHFGARSELARMQLRKLHSVVEALKISPEGTTEPETYDDETHSTIVGVCFNLDSTTSMRRVWRDPALLADTLKTICVFLKHSHQDVRTKASNKLLNLTSTALTSRHLLPRNLAFQEHVLKDVVQWLLNQLNHETNYHWRFEIVSTVILQAFMSPPPFKAEWDQPERNPHPQGEWNAVDRRRLCVVEDDALVDELILEYLRWLISGLGRGPLQAGLSIVGITHLLSAFSKHPERLSPAVVELLHTSSLESAVIGACPSTFHEVLRASTFPPYPLEIVELTQEMLRAQKEWPHVRLPKSSTVFSLKNVFFGRVYFSVLYATSPRPEETVASHIRILKKLSDAPVVTEIEAHIACAELTAGFLVFMQELEPELQTSIWTGQLESLFLQELERASVERVWDWVDCIRFVFLAKSAKGSKHLIRLVLNTILNPLGSSDSMWEPLVIFKDPSDDQTPYKGTFADLKRFYLLRFALEVLPTENQDASLLGSVARSLLGLQDVESVQGREEVQRGLLTIRAICSRPDCPDEFRKVEDIIVQGVHEAAMGVIPELLVDSSSKDSRTPEQSRIVNLGEALTRHYFFGNAFELRAISEEFFETTLPLTMCLLRHPDNEVSSLGFQSVAACIGSSRNSPISPKSQDDFDVKLVQHVHAGFRRAVESPEWKVRKAVVLLICFIATRFRFSLLRGPHFESLIDISFAALQDRQAEVRSTAKNNLSHVLLGLDDRRCEACRQKFLSVAGDPRATGDVALSSSEFVRIHAGVLGLCALVDSVPYTVPAWVPETVAALARYANDRSADVIRTTVQKCLQDFLRTHQEAWEEQFKARFSEAQLLLLESYKGRPSYFS